MITVKDFAAQQGCGESIVYRHIRNHKNELGDRVQKQHGKTWLTEEGAEYIRSLMNQPQVTFVESDAAKEELERVKLECAQMVGQVKLLKALLDEKDAKLLQFAAPEEQISALEAQNRVLSADNEKKDKFLGELETKLEAASGELREAKKEIKAGGDALEKVNMTLCRTIQERDLLNEYVKLPWWKRVFLKPPVFEEEKE